MQPTDSDRHTHPPEDPWCGRKPALRCELEQRAALPSGSSRLWCWDGLTERFAYTCPTDEVLEALVGLSPLVEAGAGSGYWARLLRDLGADVLAFDHAPPESGEAWEDVRCQEASDVLPEHPDRTLLVCMPWRPSSPPIWSWYQGARMVIVTQAPYPNPANEGLREPQDLLAQHGWAETKRLDLWDPLPGAGYAAFFYERT